MDLVKRLEEYRDRERGLSWEGTFAQYFELASKKPAISRLSHERIYHMIMDAGTEATRTGARLVIPTATAGGQSKDRDKEEKNYSAAHCGNPSWVASRSEAVFASFPSLIASCTAAASF